VERLLRVEGLDVNRGRPDTGATPLYMACEMNHEAVVERLLAHDAIDVNQATTDEYGDTPLYIACQNNHEAVVERLLAHDAIDVNQATTDDGTTPLYIACEENHEAVVERLLAHDAIDVNQARTSDGRTPLYMACLNGHEAVVEWLLAHGASVTRCFFSSQMCLITTFCCIPCCVFKMHHCCMVPAIMKSLFSRICTSSSTQKPSRKLLKMELRSDQF